MLKPKRWRTVTMSRFALLQQSLLRLLAINLAAGVAAAALLLGGLLAVNPFGLRELIFADSAPAAALGLLLFGFIITFGSTAMGTAVMAIGQGRGDDLNSRHRSAGAGPAARRRVRWDAPRIEPGCAGPRSGRTGNGWRRHSMDCPPQ